MDMNTSGINQPRTMIHSVEKAKEAVHRVFRSYSGSLAIRFWNGETVELGAGSPRATVVFRAPGPFRELALFRDPLRLAEAYFQGLVDVEGERGDVSRVASVHDGMRPGIRERWHRGLPGPCVQARDTPDPTPLTRRDLYDHPCGHSQADSSGASNGIGSRAST
ncbi:MAG: hypothetical protein HY526_11205 [Betaproteobacteria bacterium]|nr:hypothetical protein [Betaproteobacteria bacterium]